MMSFPPTPVVHAPRCVSHRGACASRSSIQLAEGSAKEAVKMEVFTISQSDTLRRYEGWKRKQLMDELRYLQVAVFVAAGGGMIGLMYAEQPLHAYRDTRAGRAPYGSKATENIRQVLIVVAELLKLDPSALPPMPSFHNCGVF